MRIHARSILAVLGAIAFTTAAILGTTPAASAAPASTADLNAVVCTGTETDTLSPAVTNTPKTVTTTVAARYGCINPVNLTAPKAATINYTVTRQLSCEDLLLGRSGSLQIVWSNGKTSTFAFTSTVTEPNGTVVVTQTGTITNGLYAGAATERTLVAPNLNLTACATTGISNRTGTSTLTIQQL